MKCAKIRCNHILWESVTDGPGIRAVLFVQGCPHRCDGCHNSDTHDFSGGYLADPSEILAEIEQNPLISGITLSGGEPMCQAAALCPLAEQAAARGLAVAVYTGYTLEALLSEGDCHRLRLLSLCDVIVDGRFELSKRSLDLPFRGSSNQRILDAKKSLAAGQAVPIAHGAWAK